MVVTPRGLILFVKALSAFSVVCAAGQSIGYFISTVFSSCFLTSTSSSSSNRTTMVRHISRIRVVKIGVLFNGRILPQVFALSVIVITITSVVSRVTGRLSSSTIVVVISIQNLNVGKNFTRLIELGVIRIIMLAVFLNTDQTISLSHY